MSSFRPALFLGSYDQTVVRDFPCRASVFGRTQYTLLRLYPLCFGSIWPLDAAEPLFMMSLLVCLSAYYLRTPAFISGSTFMQRPASDPNGDSQAQRCVALRHCFVAAVRLSFHVGCLLTVLQLWWRYGKQTGAMLLSLGSGRYYLVNNRFQIILFCLVQDVGALKMPLQLHVPLALMQAALGFATAVTCDLMTLGSVQQPFQTLAVFFCGMVVVPTSILCIIERPQRQACCENCTLRNSLCVKSVVDEQAGYGVPEPARAVAAARWFPSQLLRRPEEFVNEKALTLVRSSRQQSGAGDGNVGATSAAVSCSDGGDGGDGVAGIAAKGRHDDLAEVARCGAGTRGEIDDTVTGDGSTCSTSREATASFSNSGTSSSNDTTVWADAAMSISGPLPVLYGQSESAAHFGPCYHDTGSSFARSSTHRGRAGDEPELWMCAAEIRVPQAGEETRHSVRTDSRVSGLMPCDGTCWFREEASEIAVDVTAAMSSAAHNLPGGNRDRSTAGTSSQSGTVLCSQPLQFPERPRRPVLDLRLLNPAHVPTGDVDLHGAGMKHGGAGCGSGAPAGCVGQRLAGQEGRGAVVTAVVCGSAVSAARGSNLLYTSRLSSCVVSVKVDSHHFAGGEGFPQAAAALSGAASEAVRAYNTAVLSAALRSNAAASGDGVRPGSYGRKLIRKLGGGAVVRGCVHLIHVVRFPRSFNPHALSRQLQLPLPHDLEDGDAESPCVEAVASNIISTAEDAYTPVHARDTQSQRRVMDPAVAVRESGPGAFPLPGFAAFGGTTAVVPSGEAVGLSSGLCGSEEGCEVGTRGRYGSWRVSDGGSSSHDEAAHWSPFISGERYVSGSDNAGSDGGDLDPTNQAFAAGGPSNGGVRMIHIEIAAAPEISSSIGMASMAQLRGVGGGGAVSGGSLVDYAAEPQSSVSPFGERQWSAVRDAYSGPLDGTAGGVVGSMVGGGLAWQHLHNFISIADPMAGGSGISGVSGSADGFAVSSRSGLRSCGSKTQQQTAGNGLASCADKASESLAHDRYGRKPIGEGVEMGIGAVVRDKAIGTMEQRENAPGGEDADVMTGGTHAPGAGVTVAAASGSGLNLQMELLRAYEQAAIAVSMTAAARGTGILETHRNRSLGGDGGGSCVPVEEFGGAVGSPRGSDHQQPLHSWDLLDSCNGIGGGEELLPCYLDAVAVALSGPDSEGARPKVRVVLSREAVAAIAELQPQPAQEMDTDVRSKVSELRVRVVIARAGGDGEASSSAVLDEPRVPLQPLQPLPQVDQQVEEQQQRQQQQVEGGHAHCSIWPAACLEVEMPTSLLLVEAVGGAMAVFIHLLAPREAPSDGSGQLADDKSHRGVASVVSDKLEPEPPIRGSVLPALWLLQRSQSNTVSCGSGALGAGAGSGIFTPVRVLRGSHNRVLAVLPLLLVADHAVAEELGMAYDEHATAIFFDSGATEEELQPHLPYSGSRLMAYRDHLYDLVTDIAELLTPPFPSPPAPPMAEAPGAAPDSEALADLALIEATMTGEQILSYMCCRGMWASARMVVGVLWECWGVEVGGAETLWAAASVPAFSSGTSIPHKARATAVDLSGCPGTASNEQFTRRMPTQGAVAGLSTIGESSWSPHRALVRAGGSANICEVLGSSSSGEGTSRGQAGVDGGDGHSGIANGDETHCVFPVPRVIAQITCALKFAAVAAAYSYVVLQSSPQALHTVTMWGAPFIAVLVSMAMAMNSPAFLSVPWSAAWGLLLDGLLLGLVVMTCEVLSVLLAQGQPVLQSVNSDVAGLSPEPTMSSAMVVQVIAALMAVRALAYVSVSLRWLGRPWASAVTQWAAAVLGNLLVAHWLWRS